MSKVMISLPDELLAALDAEATKRDQSRSALIRSAVREHLSRSALDERHEALHRLRRSFGGMTQSPEELLRVERER